MDQLIPGLAHLVEPFRDCFRAEVFQTFQALLAGWIVCLGWSGTILHSYSSVPNVIDALTSRTLDAASFYAQAAPMDTWSRGHR